MDSGAADFTLDGASLTAFRGDAKARWDASQPFRHVVVDNFLPARSAALLSELFPGPDHPVWLDWRKRSPFQYGKQGPGDAQRFDTVDPRFLAALQQFNSWKFLDYVGHVTSIPALLPDPYFTGGGMHQILPGGILDIHTDFNYYSKLNVYRRLNALLYLTSDWRPSYGGCLELWDDAPQAGGKCFRELAPVFNRLVIFETDKKSFHGHPREWTPPDGSCRRSIALYYYTAARDPEKLYDERTDFQGYASKPLPVG